jgi:hypothetical protein
LSDVLVLVKGLLLSVFKEALHSLVKQTLLTIKKRTAPCSSDGSDVVSGV